MPEGLLESELFGHVRGAFTGAHASKRGLFEEANGGTIFLDEIGDMSPALQSKLLRVLQDHEIRPVGGNKAVRVDVRVIAATNRDLQADVAAGRFRQDLFYRLNVISIHIPPLRERPEDIPLLARAFLERHAPGAQRCACRAAALELLQRQRWEGNARELENALERALLLATGDEIRPPSCRSRATARAPRARRWTARLGARAGRARRVEAQMSLRRALGALHGAHPRARATATRSARRGSSGINRRTLYRRGVGRHRAARAARRRKS